MRYLIQLVTPPNSTILDPFCGSGSTGMAAVELGHEFVGCELDSNYVNIANTRIRAWNTPDPTGTTYESLFEEQ
jgi:site-specific DNA-methyltransferase (adenine-specific)